MLFKVRHFVNANVLKSIYYALFESHINYACIICAPSYGDKISVQITTSTFSRKKHKELSITPLLYFIALKLSKLQIKSRLRTASLQTNIPIINYFQFLLIGLHFHQCLTIIKYQLPLKEIFKSLMFKQYHIEKIILFTWLYKLGMIFRKKLKVWC